MAREIFIHTGAWLALAHNQDALHRTAVKAYPPILRQWTYQLTTNLIVAESHALIRQRVGHAAGMQFLSALENTASLILIYSDSEIERHAKEILRRYTDQDFSYADSVSFAVMQQRGIEHAFAFDRHFLT